LRASAIAIAGTSVTTHAPHAPHARRRRASTATSTGARAAATRAAAVAIDACVLVYAASVEIPGIAIETVGRSTSQKLLRAEHDQESEIGIPLHGERSPTSKVRNESGCSKRARDARLGIATRDSRGSCAPKLLILEHRIERAEAPSDLEKKGEPDETLRGT